MRKSTSNIVKKYLAYFLVMLLIPILSMTVIYVRVSVIVTDNAYQQTQTAMKSSAQIIQKHLDDLRNLSYNIAQTGQTSRFFFMNGLATDRTIVSDVYEIQKDLKAFTVVNNLISSIQLYNRNADLIIDSQTSALNLSRYYGPAFRVVGLDAEGWREDYLQHTFKGRIMPSRMVYDGRSTKRRITFAQSVPQNARSYSNGSIFIYVDEDALLRLFSAVPYKNGGFLRIYDRSCELVVEDNPLQLPIEGLDAQAEGDAQRYSIQDIDGQDQLIIRYDDGQWYYVMGIPHTDIIASTQEIRTFLMLLIALTLLGGIALSFFYAYKTSAPVISVYRQLTSGGSVSPNDLGDEFAILLTKNADLKTMVDQQLPAQRMALVYNLLSGGFTDEDSVRRDFAKLDMTLDAQCFLVMVVVLTDLDVSLPPREIGLYKEVVKELLGDLSGIIGVCDMDFERIVLLAGCPQPDGNALREQLSHEIGQVGRRALEDVGISLYFSCCLSPKLADIPSAFLSVQSAVFTAVSEPRQSIHWCGTEDESACYYPENLASQLISAVSEGKSALVRELLGVLMQGNARYLASESTDAPCQLPHLMYGTLMRVAAGLPAGNDAFQNKCSKIGSSIARQDTSPAEFCNALQAAFMEAAQIRAEHTPSGRALYAQILDHVNKNYADPQISLSSVADTFGITEVYLSRMFKQSTGENFSSHIEKLRMDRANKLIAQGQRRISEIAELVGYNSPQVFRRAYKRCFGISPSGKT